MSLSVYTTTGSCLYPEEGDDDPTFSDYENSVVFLADLENQFTPTIETVFKAELPNGVPKTLFLRYEGNNPETIFENCRKAVLGELVEERDWTIQEIDDADDPAKVFQRTVLKPALDPSSIARETHLEGYLDTLRSELRDDNQLTITCSNYQIVADTIRTFSDESITIAVTEGGREASADLSIQMESQEPDLKLGPESQHLLPPESVFEPAASDTPPGDTGQGSTATASSGSDRSGPSGDRTAGEVTGSGAADSGEDRPGESQPEQSGSGVSSGIIFGAIAIIVVITLVGIAVTMTGVLSDETAETPVEIQNATASLVDTEMTVAFNITAPGTDSSVVAAVFYADERLGHTIYNGGERAMQIDNGATVGAGDRIVLKAARGESFDAIGGDEWQDSRNITVTDERSTSVSVAITDAPTSVTAGDEMEIGYMIENTGEKDVTRDIELMVNGEPTTMHPNTEVSAGGSWTATLAVEVESDWGPNATVTVQSGDAGSQTREIIVQQPTLPVEINEVDVRSVAPTQGQIVLTLTVTNVGDEPMTLTGETMDVEISGRSWIYNGNPVVVETGETVTRDLLFITGPLDSIDESGQITIGPETYVFDIPTNE